ncbi:MAG: right-handed parallel beta-helix repeat-containing protein [Draconibacterium sp.]|nr:right-handed parallel beta-helix repeat-containing protein [Draconibacterium sp.]
MFNSTTLTNSSQGVRIVNLLVKSSLLLKYKLFQSLLITLVIFSTNSLNATNYYVSSSGNDSNAGTSESLPWKTLTKVNSFTPKAGDQILFKRGDEWTGSITVKASGTSSSRITYGAYGTGTNPKIYGSEKISGWTQYSGNIYKATFSTLINQLFVNDLRMKIARYPNTGYALINTVNSTKSFTCDALNGSINYSGAKWIGRTIAYSIVTHDVVSSTSKTLTLSEVPYANLNTNEGFILVNKLEFLDSAGEWYYDIDTKTVYLWTPNGDSPTNYIVSGSTVENGIVATGKDYITIRDLEILNNKSKGITFSGNYVTVDNNIVSNPDSRGIDIVYGSNCTVSNNTVTGANHSGIFTYSTNCLIADNKVNDTFLFNNIGISGSGSWYMGSGICVEGDDNLIKYNRVISAGYNGISFSKRNIVEFNYIKNVLLTKDDGGGIYAASAGSYPNAATAGSIIRNNIVDGVFGTLEGWDTWILRGGHGIFLDENGGGVTIENNIVANCTGTCVFLHKSFNETIKNNLLFNARRGFAINQDLGGSQFKNNIIYVLKKDIDNKGIEYLVSKYQGNVEINYNTYISHYNSTNVFMLEEVKSYDFTGWKTVTGQDANSTIDLSPLSIGDTEELFYNDTKQTKLFNLGSSIYKDIYGNQVMQSVTLEPFTSKILIKTSSVNITDNIIPTINSFSIPSSSPTLIVPINSFSAQDNNSVLGYMITESTTPPKANDTGWIANAPSSYTFTTDGSKTLYAWVKDVAGNISKSLSGQVTITLPSDITKFLGNIDVTNFVSTTANRRAIQLSLTENGKIESISIFHNGGTGNLLMGVYADQAGSPSSLLGVTTSTTINTTTGWQTVPLLNPVNVVSGQKVWLSWVFQNNPGIRYNNGTPSRAQSAEIWSAGMPAQFGTASFADYNYSIYCTFSKENLETPQPDVTKPVVSAFIIPTTSSSLIVSVSSFTATDNIAVTGYLLTENSTVPTAGNSEWNAAAPTSYSFSSEGTKTLYAWTKDAAGNVSASKSAQVVITLPDVTKPVVSAFIIPTTSSSLIVSVTSFTATDNIAVTGYLLTENSTVPTAGNSEWNAQLQLLTPFLLKEQKPFMHGQKMLPEMFRQAKVHRWLLPCPMLQNLLCQLSSFPQLLLRLLFL